MLDKRAGDVLADIDGGGSSWYNIHEIGIAEVEQVRRELDKRYSALRILAYAPDFKQK